MAERVRTPGRRIAVAAILDVAFVVLFVVIGRASHREGDSPTGVAGTLWPFLSALTLGWLVTVAWRDPARIRWPGIPVWLVTVAGGMALRSASMQGVDLPFVVVATIVLGFFLLGWRAIAYAITRSRVGRLTREDAERASTRQ